MDIIIVEDNESTRYRLVSIVEGFGEHRVVASFETVEEAVDFFAENTADIVILDLGLPGLSDDLAVKAIKAASPASTILVFTVKDEDEKIFSALKAGAIGYLLKDDDPSRIRSAIEELQAGGTPMSHVVARKVLEEFRRLPVVDELKDVISPLSKREKDILELLYRGHNYHYIAGHFRISPHTVHTHIKKIYSKLQVNSRSEAIYHALQNRLLKK